MTTTCDSVIARISIFLDTQKAGKTFVYDDFKTYGSYHSLRTAMARLCTQSKLIRLCHGVFMKPGLGLEEVDPTIIANEIARRNNSQLFFKSDETLGALRTISFYTDGSTRTFPLFNGIILKFIHKSLDQ